MPLNPILATRRSLETVPTCRLRVRGLVDHGAGGQRLAASLAAG